MSSASTRNASSEYLRTGIMTAGPGRLRLMLLDGALRFAEKGRQGLASRNWEDAFEGLSRCRRILLELGNGLRPEQAPDLCRRLAGLYTFLYTRLIQAGRDRDPAAVEEVIDLLRYERETWAMLLEKLAGGDGAGGPRAEAAAAAGGRVSLRG